LQHLLPRCGIADRARLQLSASRLCGPFGGGGLIMPARKRWSAHVTKTSNALDLDAGVFTRPDSRSIARSLKRSADRSRRRKTDSFRSAMSMLSFYMNRAGSKLSNERRKRLEAAKDKLRELYGRRKRNGKVR